MDTSVFMPTKSLIDSFPVILQNFFMVSNAMQYLAISLPASVKQSKTSDHPMQR